MANESARGFRGWIYAVFVAFCLLMMFFASEYLSKLKQPGYYRAPRTAWLNVSTKPINIPKIATEAVPLPIEPLNESLDSATWVDYRSTQASTISMLEPPAGARLSAPVSSSPLHDPFLEAINFQRSPSMLAESAAQSSTIVTQVSEIRPVDDMPREQHVPVELKNVSAVDNTWPPSPKLNREMRAVLEIADANSNLEIVDWVANVELAFGRLESTPLNDAASLDILGSLHSLSERGTTLALELAKSKTAVASAVSRLSYSIERRYAVWISICKCILQNKTKFVSARKHEFDSERLTACLLDVSQVIQRTGDPESWKQYLMLDSLNKLATGQITGRQDQVDLVREFLSRVTDTRVSEVQRQVLAGAEVHKLADQVHPLSIGPVDYRKLVEDIETIESDPIHRCSKTLADAMQSLRFSEHAEQAAVSHAIGLHFRNANLRIAVSEDFINRMMPKNTVTNKPVRQNILGADTLGASQIATTLRADFHPDPNAWNISLNLDGDINSNTRSSRQGATFYNASIASVNAVREIKITPHGMHMNGSPASVTSSDSLKKFSTDWDSLPILGDMIRHFAHEEFLQARPLAKRIMQRTIAKQTDEEFDSQLKSKVASAQSQFEKRLIGPLQSLNLHPMVMDMQTTDSRLIVRYRVSSSDQLAANTPRPIAPGDSQISLQVHQSAFNNMAGQVVSGDRNWTMQELSDKISDLLQQPRKPLDAEAPADVTVRFTPSRPITVEFEDGRLWLTLRIASLDQPGRMEIKNFIIRTSYVPTVDGLKAELTRDGTISVDGNKIGSRDRFPLRLIFTKVFANRSAIPMVSDELLNDPRAVGLAVSQMELRDGWLAIAVSPAKSPHVANLKSLQANSSR
ncbi:MAG: hypothetical protein ABL921_19040 [Pirellula sp.]